MKPSTRVAALVLASLLFGRPGQQDGDGTPAGAKAPAGPSCTVCHAGALTSLERSPHLSLLEGKRGDAVCIECHGEAPEHEAAPKDPARFPMPGLERCVRCHEDLGAIPALARRLSHPTRNEAEEWRLLPAPRRSISKGGFETTTGWPLFEGLVRGGYRFLDVTGDERAFRQDLGLEQGARLSDLELRLRYPDEAELVSFEVRDLEERVSSARLETGDGLWRDGRFTAEGRKIVQVHDAWGDYFALDRRHRRGTLGLEYDLTKDWRVGVEWERLVRDGRTLASSIGNENATPLDPAAGVPVDFRLQVDRWTMRSESQGGFARVVLDLTWEEQRQEDDLRYTRPSPANPGFTEAEVSGSSARYHGPEASLSLVGGDRHSVEWRLFLHGRYRDASFSEQGDFAAWDTGSYTRRTDGSGSGTSRWLSGTFGVLVELSATSRLDLSTTLWDSKDDTSIELIETVVRTTPPSTVTTRTPTETVTRLRKSETAARLEWDLDPHLLAAVSYAYVHQDLTLPDLEAGDPDFTSGKLDEHGPGLELDWRPRDGSRFRLRAEGLATAGPTPTETQPENGGRVRLQVAQKVREGLEVDLDGVIDRRTNSSSDTSRNVAGLGGGFRYATDEQTSIDLRAHWVRHDTRTLSNFYFAPSTTPVPTIVGYQGETWTLTGELERRLGERWTGRLLASWQRLVGDLAQRFIELRADLGYQVTDPFGLGLRLSYWDLDDRVEPGSSYEAFASFIYAELRF
ncbi:MAG: hypothetical protein R3F30_08430 [Planctomycetota bacterium]